VYFQVQLPRADWGFPRDEHFRLANKNMRDMLRANPVLAETVGRQLGWDLNQMNAWLGRLPTETIPGFTWHHALMSQANGVPGVLQLVQGQLPRGARLKTTVPPCWLWRVRAVGQIVRGALA
jgi:hypothetical protein